MAANKGTIENAAPAISLDIVSKEAKKILLGN